MAYDIFGSGGGSGGGGGTIDEIARTAIGTHTLDTNNPHAVTKSQVGLSDVVNIDTSTTANIADSLNKRFVSDTQKAVLSSTSGTNTGDETTSTIQSKLGVSSTSTDGYLKKEDFVTFNNKANIEDVTPISHVTNTNNPHSVTKAQVGLGNVLNVDTSVTTNITDTSLKMFVSDTEKTIWNDTRRLLPNWVRRTAADQNWYSVAYGNGRFVAIAELGTNRVMVSTNGINWASYPTYNFTWFAVTYGNGIFVAVASAGTSRVMVSIDGINWTLGTIDNSTWRGITYGNGLFVAVANTGTNRIAYSTDGLSWTGIVAQDCAWRSVKWCGNKFVAVAETGTNRVMYSADGINWTYVLVINSGWLGVACGNGLYVAVAGTGDNRVMYSTDAISWTPVQVELSVWRNIAFADGLFVAVASTGDNRVMYSSDGINWFYQTTDNVSWRSIAYGDGMWVAVGNDISNGVLTFGERIYRDKGKITSKSIIGELPVTILSTEWTGTKPFEDTIPITIAGEQITNTTHDIKVSLVLSSDINIAKQEQESYSYFSKGEISATNTLKITCFEYKPTVNLNLTLEVVKKW